VPLLLLSTHHHSLAPLLVSMASHSQHSAPATSHQHNSNSAPLLSTTPQHNTQHLSLKPQHHSYLAPLSAPLLLLLSTDTPPHPSPLHLVTTHHILTTLHNPSHFTFHISNFHISHLTSQISHLTFHISHFTFHISNVSTRRQGTSHCPPPADKEK